jgi:hypothetical protein
MRRNSSNRHIEDGLRLQGWKEQVQNIIYIYPIDHNLSSSSKMENDHQFWLFY